MDNSESFDWLENIALIVRDVMSVQEFQILLMKRFALMVALLLPDVADYRAKMEMRNRRRAKTFLPRKTAANPSLLVDVIA